MKSIHQVERLRKIHKLIKAEDTGTPTELAQRLNICVSQLYSFIDDLKIVGFPIAYSRKTKTYYYQEDCTLNVVFKVQLLTLNETIQIIGGVKNNFLYSNVCGVSKFNLAIANSELRVCRQNWQPCKCW